MSYLIVFAFAMNLTVISPLLPAISKSFSIGIPESGLIFTTNFIGFVIFVLAGGVLSDKYGKKAVLFVSLVGFTLSIFAFSTSQGLYSACIIMFFLGGFGGIIETLIMALASELHPERPSYYVNLSQVFFGIGAVVGPLMAGLVLSRGLDWRICYIAVGILSLVLTAGFARCRIPRVSGGSGFSLSHIKHITSDKGFILICLCMFLYTGSEVGGWGWLATFLKQSLGFGASKASVAVSAFWLSMTAGRLLCGSLTARFSMRGIIITLSSISAAVTLLSSIVRSEAAIWVVVVAMGLAYSSQFPLIISSGSNASKEYQGTVFSLLVGSGSVGSMTVPLAMGFIGGNLSMGSAMVLPAVMLFAISMIFIFTKPYPASTS